MLPKFGKVGRTGVHFDSVDARGTSLVMIGKSKEFDEKHQARLIEIFYSIKFNF